MQLPFKLKHLAAFAVVTALALAIPVERAWAVMLNVSGTQLLGAQDVDVNGTLYDVEFVDGSCIALFSGCDDASDFAFSTISDGIAAAQALLNSVFLDTVLGNFDSDPQLTNGCGGSTCNVFIPVVAGFAGGRATNDAVESSDIAGVIGGSSANDLSLDLSATFARFSPASASITVSEPATAWLFGLGLAALLLAGWQCENRRRAFG